MVKEREIAKAATSAALPEGWRRVKFGDVVRNVDVAERDPLENGLERYVGLEHLDAESLHIKRWGLIEEGTSFTRKFVRGQMLFGKRRAYQRKAALADFNGICSGDILVFESKDDNLIPELLPFIVQSDGFFEKALGTSAGSLSPRTKWKDLAAYEFALPPKGEQRRIAEILWEAENTFRRYRDVQSNLIILKSEYTNSIFAAHNCGNESSDNSLLSVNEVCKKVSDGEHLSPKVIASGRYLLSAKDIRDEAISFEEPKYVSEEDFQKFRRRCDPRPSDILIVSRGATIGRCHLIKTGTPDFALMGSVIQIRPNQDIIDPLFLLGYLRQAETQRRIVSAAGATAQPAIYLKYLKELPVPVPSLERQQHVAAQVNRLDDALRAEEDHLQILSDLKKSLNKSLLNPVMANS